MVRKDPQPRWPRGTESKPLIGPTPDAGVGTSRKMLQLIGVPFFDHRVLRGPASVVQPGRLSGTACGQPDWQGDASNLWIFPPPPLRIRRNIAIRHLVGLNDAQPLKSTNAVPTERAQSLPFTVNRVPISGNTETMISSTNLIGTGGEKDTLTNLFLHLSTMNDRA